MLRKNIRYRVLVHELYASEAYVAREFLFYHCVINGTNFVPTTGAQTTRSPRSCIASGVAMT